MALKKLRAEAWQFSTGAAVPVLAAVFASIMLAALTLRLATERADRLAEMSQRRAVEYALNAQAQELATQQKLALAETRPGRVHAVGASLARAYRHDVVVAFAGRSRVGEWRADAARPGPDPAEAASLDKLVMKEAAPPAGAEPQPRTELLKVGDHVAVASIIRVPARSGAIDIVSIRYLSEAFLRDAAGRSSLQAIDVRPAGAEQKGAQSLVLRASDGTPLASLVWKSDKPGSRMLAALWPLATVSACGAVLVMSLLVRHLDQTTGELRKREAEARDRALHDQLTGLPNRQHFNERLEAAMRSARGDGEPIALLCLDLDRFKLVNDTLGHPAGDRLLCEFAARLRTVVRGSDFVARLGGDEFVVIQYGIRDKSAATPLCERIIDIARQSFDLDGAQAFVDVSIGVARSVGCSGDSAELIRRADIALYEAKAAGRACYRLFDDAMGERVRVRSLVERELREAIATDNGLRLLYQPLVQARSGRMVGVEALLRWQHPTMGLIQPAQFIPVAEETGLINDLGEWVLARACEAAHRWPGLQVAVNLSPVQFRDPGLPERLLAIVARHGVDPRRIELEITEGVLLAAESTVGDQLTRLRAGGFRVALDDFGTGYSSLNYLTRFRVDKIKIDRGFVQRLGAGPETMAVVQAVIALGHALGVTTTAEGVEAESQRDLLSVAGIDELQGYLVARPLDADDVDRFIGDAVPRKSVA